MKTGGIYFSANDSSKIVETVTKCMKNGSGGGESKENDIEAITLALNKFPQASEVILIADNKEWMRDFDYLTKIVLLAYLELTCYYPQFSKLILS